MNRCTQLDENVHEYVPRQPRKPYWMWRSELRSHEFFCVFLCSLEQDLSILFWTWISSEIFPAFCGWTHFVTTFFEHLLPLLEGEILTFAICDSNDIVVFGVLILKSGATFSKLSWDIFQRSSYVGRFRNSKEVFFSEFLTAFFAFPTEFFFSYLCRLPVVQPIRCAYTDHVMQAPQFKNFFGKS